MCSLSAGYVQHLPAPQSHVTQGLQVVYVLYVQFFKKNGFLIIF